MLLMFRVNDRMRSVGKLCTSASLTAIEKVKIGMDVKEQVTIQMRKTDDNKPPYVLNLHMSNNA
jgi:hypothetical protein